LHRIEVPRAAGHVAYFEQILPHVNQPADQTSVVVLW